MSSPSDTTGIPQMTATEFKAKCLKIIDTLDSTGLIITKRGKPVAKLTPAGGKSFMDYYGCLKGKLKITGNVFSTGIKWSADQENLRPPPDSPKPGAKRP